jgi:heme/copper-type cytochrome/quinol oxidase subunit 1
VITQADMRDFLMMITIAPMFWAFMWLLCSLVMQRPLDSPWRKIAGLFLWAGVMVMIGVQAPIGHVGHPRGAHVTAFVWTIAVDCLPALAIGLFLNRDQQKRISDGRLTDDSHLSLGL